MEVVASLSQGRTAAGQCGLFTHKSVPVIFEPHCISNKMQRYTVYLFLETALHISGGISTHHQEHKQLYLQHLVPAAIVEEMELICSSNSSTIAAGSSKGMTSTRYCKYSCVCS